MRFITRQSHSSDKKRIHRPQFYWISFLTLALTISPQIKSLFHFPSFILCNSFCIIHHLLHSTKLDFTGSSMAATVSAMAMASAKCFNSPKLPNPTKLAATKSNSLLSFQNLPKGLTSETTTVATNPSTTLAGTAIAGAVFAALSSADAAMAAQQIAELAEGGDNRGIALLLPIIPAIAWVLFNILQPALNQLNRMRSSKGVIVGLGLGGLVGSGLLGWAPESSAAEVATIAAEAASDNRGQLLLFVVAPAILWVLYNILQPALNQLNRMRSQ